MEKGIVRKEEKDKLNRFSSDGWTERNMKVEWTVSNSWTERKKI